MTTTTSQSMTDSSDGHITRLLHDWQSGDREALDRLIPLVYDELRLIASRQLFHEPRHGPGEDPRVATTYGTVAAGVEDQRRLGHRAIVPAGGVRIW